MLVGKNTDRNIRILHTLHAIFHILIELLARVFPTNRHSIMETLLIRCFVCTGISRKVPSDAERKMVIQSNQESADHSPDMSHSYLHGATRVSSGE